jgi:hypothetical protein
MRSWGDDQQMVDASLEAERAADAMVAHHPVTISEG